MKSKSTVAPQDYTLERINGTALLRFYENIREYKTPETDSEPADTGYEFDCYTIKRRYYEGLMERIESDIPGWLALAREEERRELAEAVRARRDSLLKASDKTQMPDYPISDACREGYCVYRQLLRDVPEQTGFPEEVEWPGAP